MVKTILAGTILLASLSLMTCDNQSFDLDQLVPWYVPYIKTSVDIPDLLPDRYRDRDILVTRLVGPDALNPNNSIAYIVLAQNRDPDPPLIAVFDAGLRLKLAVSNQTAAPLASWFIDPLGDIEFGPFRVVVAKTPGGAWTVGAPPTLSPLPQTNAANFAYVNGTTLDYVNFTITTTSPSLFINRYSYLFQLPLGWQTGSNSSLSLINMNTYLPNLFPGYTITSIANPQLVTCTPDYTVSPPMLNIFLTVEGSDGSQTMTSPVFSLRVSLSEAAGTPTSTSFLNFDLGGLSGSSYYSQSQQESSLSAVFTGDGFVRCLPFENDSDGTRLPMVFTNLQGSKVASMVLRMPEFPSLGSSHNDARNSSIAQRPYYLTGSSDFITVDGFHKRLFLCSAWWK